MLNKVAPTTLSSHIRDTRNHIGGIQFSDQYRLEIQMLAPIKKVAVPHELIKGFTLNSAGLGIEAIQAGGRALNHFSENTPDDISITFYNKINVGYTDIPFIKDGIGRIKHLQDIARNAGNRISAIGGLFGIAEVTDPINEFLTDTVGYGDRGLDLLSDSSKKINDLRNLFSFGSGGSSNPFLGFKGNSIEVLTSWYFFKVGMQDIVPKDGTMLLPEDWKFEIVAYSLDGAWHENKIEMGTYNIDGNTQIAYTSDGGAMQEFELNFKRLI